MMFSVDVHDWAHANRVSCGASAFFKSKRPRNVRWSVPTNIQLPPGVLAHYNNGFDNTIIKIIHNQPPRLNCNCCSIIYHVREMQFEFHYFQRETTLCYQQISRVRLIIVSEHKMYYVISRHCGSLYIAIIRHTYCSTFTFY